MPIHRIALLCSAAVLCLPAAAFADTETDASPPAAAASSGDIVVTATRRAERLQDVALAVTALGSQQIAAGGFQKLNDLQFQMPSLQFGVSPNDSGFRLRGVGSAGGFASSSEQNVGTVVDNVVIPFGNPMASLGDVERIEALEGPQGTQFGKNASSGVVNITTAKPKFDATTGKAFVSYGSLNEVNLNAQLNLPTSANSAFAVYGFFRRNDGYVWNTTLNTMWGGEKSYGGRAKFYWEPSDDLSVYVIGDFSRTVDRGPGQLWTLNALPSDMATNPLMAARFAPVLAAGITPGIDNTQTAEHTDGQTAEQDYGVSLEINKKLGTLDLTSITAYRGFVQEASQYAIDGTSVLVFNAEPDSQHQRFFSQELRLSTPKGSRLEITGGVYASLRKTGTPSDYNAAQLYPSSPFPFSPAPGVSFTGLAVNISAGLSNTQTRSNSTAAFFDGKYRLTGKLSALGGFRYQYDWVASSFSSSIDPNYAPGSVVNGYFVAPYTTQALETGHVNKGGWSGRAGLEYKLERDVMLYGTVARGYLGPTVTFSGLTGTRSNVLPQTVRDITLGLKSQWFNRKLTFNADVFLDSYSNLQTSVFNGVEFLTGNAGGFHANGFEFDTSWRFSRAFSLHGGLTYSPTKFTDYTPACPAVLMAGLTCAANGTVQVAGQPLAGAPKVTGAFGANLSLPINDALTFDGSGNVYYRSRVYYDVGDPLSTQAGYATVGLNLGVGAANGSWHVGAFARNLLNKHFVAAVIGLPFADAGGEVNWRTREGQRTLGLSAQVKF